MPSSTVKLLYYSHAFAPQVGGIETYSVRLIAGLTSMAASGEKFDITVATQTPSGNNDLSRHLPIKVARKPGLWRLWRLVGQADVVILAGAALAPLAISILRKKKIIVTHHGYQTICPNGLLLHLPTQKDCPGYFENRRYVECVRCGTKEMAVGKSALRVVLTFPRRVFSRFATRNVFVSEHSARRIRLPNSLVIRNGVPEASGVWPEATWKNFTSAPPFVYVGRLVVEKGVNVIIEAAALLKARGREFRVLLVGDGPERGALELQVRRQDVAEEVEFVGFQTGKELEAIVNTPSVFLMPSVCQDVAPFAPLEQMMRGNPVIASDIGGLAEEVGDTGLKFPPGNATALADAMEKLILHPELGASLGARARGRAIQQYHLNEMIRGYATLLEATVRK